VKEIVYVAFVHTYNTVQYIMNSTRGSETLEDSTVYTNGEMRGRKKEEISRKSGKMICKRKERIRK
jgi:hypothetical protein